jgi:hypothetical protein
MSCLVLGQPKDYAKEMLDDMTAFFEGPGSVYDPEYYDNLTSCMTKWDDTLLF